MGEKGLEALLDVTGFVFFMTGPSIVHYTALTHVDSLAIN